MSNPPRHSLDEPDRYGASFADVYDRWYNDIDPVDAVVDRLLAVSNGPYLLELGAGTGRLATPLARAGFFVTALDISLDMLRRVHPPGPGERLAPVMGDMTALPIATDTIDVAVVAYNTLFTLPNPALQTQMFSEAARAIQLDGLVIVDAIVPAAPPPGIAYRVASSREDDGEVVLIATCQRGGDARVTGAHLQFTSEGFFSRPWTLTPQNPASIDAMAAAVGLSLIERSSDWVGTPFTGGGRHISFYGF